MVNSNGEHMSVIVFFFIWFCDVAEIVIILKPSLAKFGYQTNMNRNLLNILTHFWLPTWTEVQKCGDSFFLN